jgi:hypothetical protein
VSWWRSLYLRNGLKLEDETLQLVAQYVQCAQEPYAERMMRFAIDGDGDAVLDEIVKVRRKNHQVFWASDVRTELSRESGNQLFANVQVLHPGLCYRLAKLDEVFGTRSQQPFGWLHQLLFRISPHGLIASFDDIRSISLSIESSFVEQLLEASGESTNALAKLVYFANPEDFHRSRRLAITYAMLQGFNLYSLKHANIIREALQQKQSSRRNFVLEILIHRNVSIEPFIDLIIKMAFSSGKGERELAAKFLIQEVQKVIHWVQTMAIDGTVTERNRAVQILWTLQGKDSHPFLKARLSSETSMKVVQSIEVCLSTATEPPECKPIELPSLDWIKCKFPLPESIKQILAKALDTLKTPTRHFNLIAIEQCLETATARECSYCLSPTVKEKNYEFKTILEPIFKHPDLSSIHAFRILTLFGYFHRNFDSRLISGDFLYLLGIYRCSHPEVDLRELAAVFEVLELKPEQLGRYTIHCASEWCHESRWWGKKTLWPYFYEYPHLLEEAFKENIQSWGYSTRKQYALQILSLFPHVPSSLIPFLWSLALSNAKTERPIAQKYLNVLPNITEQLLKILQSQDVDQRTIAAEWLTNRNDTVAIAPLKKLLLKEKSDVAKVAFMRSLERLGASIDEFLNRDQLLTDAQKGLKRGMPDALSWFSFTDLPPVHWADNQLTVDSTILVWFIVQSYKQKSLEPNPLLQRYAQMWQESDRLAIGNFVLKQWITQDTSPTYIKEQAEFLAQKNVPTYAHYYPNKTQEQLYREHLNHLLSQCKGSAIKEKGILAIASACITGATAVPIVKKYLDTWYGNRSAQCNALLQMLSWIEDNAAIQYLLSVANRFRTCSIQKEAAKMIQAIAERHQWTPEELGDRTIPTAGFNPDRTLTLDYGSRQFTLTLDARLNPILKNADGKVLKVLPTPNQQDDSTLATAAKATFSQTKKELKQVLQIQKTRLYEAMTVQRLWSYSDWESLLNQHPILGLYTQSLVWGVYENDILIQTIRPLGDGTLTTLDDREATLSPDAVLRLAHTSLMSPNDVQTWNAHLSDYEIVPPFMQFWTGLYTIPNDPQITELNDFQKQTLESFHLRGRATQRGYNRGPTGDSGYFWTYHKTFSSIGIEAVIEFSGNSLPEENIEVEMQGLYFYNPSDRSDREVYDLSFPNKLPLQSVPPVLLQECWNDLRHIMSAS